MKTIKKFQTWALLAPTLGLVVLLQASPNSEASSSGIVTAPLTDDDVERAIERVLRYDLQVDAGDIDIDVKEGIVELSGFVENLPMKRHAVELAETRKGVRSIVDRMDVRGISVEDEVIQHSLDRALEFQAATFGIGVEPIVNDGVVRLHGKVESFALSNLIERTAESIVGVRAVSNMLHVEADDTRDDVELRRHIELALAQDPWIDAGLAKVEVDEGSVEVSGMVDALSEKRRLGETIGAIPGVKAIDDSQLAIRVDATLKLPTERHEPPKRPDGEIKQSVEDTLRFDPRVRGSQLEVAVQGGVVSLNGTVGNLKAHRAAEANARNTLGVSHVYNFSKIRPKNPLPDDELAESLERLLEADSFLAGSDVGNITADSGQVRLRGMVKSEYQRQRAEDLASGAIGVREVRNYLRVDWPLPEAYQDLVEIGVMPDGGFELHLPIMIAFQLLEDEGLLIVEPSGPLSPDDFEQMTAQVDHYLARAPSLKGILIHVREFPGWKNFGGMMSHFRFVRDHHRQIEKVALASDSALATIVPKLAEHFVAAQIEGFDFDERDAALAWLRSDT